MIIIESIVDYPDMAPQIAGWLYKEWNYLEPHASVEDWTESIRKQIHKDRIPVMFVARDKSKPVGCIALVTKDTATSMDFSPWLGAFYVTEDYRGQGVGLRLAGHLIRCAKNFGVPTLYACVTDERLKNIAHRRGWNTIGQEFYKNRSVTVISLELNP
jgi:GNAT superfamily N-acetyltransferase